MISIEKHLISTPILFGKRGNRVYNLYLIDDTDWIRDRPFTSNIKIESERIKNHCFSIWKQASVSFSLKS